MIKVHSARATDKERTAIIDEMNGTLSMFDDVSIDNAQIRAPLRWDEFKEHTITRFIFGFGFVIRKMFSPKYTRLANITLQLGRAKANMALFSKGSGISIPRLEMIKVHSARATDKERTAIIDEMNGRV
jgi:hypothetical protein